MSVLVDTSFLFSLTDTNDRHHESVAAVTQTMTEPLIISLTVLPEICYLIASRLGHNVMRRFLRELVSSDAELEAPTRSDLQRSQQILDQYADSRLDFVDTTLVAIAERRNITRILTLDRRDFTMIRPRHCAYFEILP